MFEHSWNACAITFLSIGWLGAAMTLTASRTLPVPLATIMSYQNPKLVERYSTYTGATPDLASRAFEGMKQFLAVCAMTPGWKVTSEPIDAMWHTFLLFTRDYATFCERNFGFFLHHEPFDVPRPELYAETKAVASQFFGALDDEMWPVKAKGDCSSGCGS